MLFRSSPRANYGSAVAGMGDVDGDGVPDYAIGASEHMAGNGLVELRSGADQGKRAYSVNVLVTGPGQRYIRQLIAGYPAYTEDMVFTDDRAQPVKRAVKVSGKPTVDERLFLALDYAPADSFYLKNDLEKSWALYVRRPGDAKWVERPIVGLPLYNDSVPELGEVFVGPGSTVRAGNPGGGACSPPCVTSWRKRSAASTRSARRLASGERSWP